MDADRMPGDAEALGAIAGMNDTYGHMLPAVGDQVWWRITPGTWDSGRVQSIAPGLRPRLVVRSEFDGTVYTIDARMWPEGNRLDF